MAREISNTEVVIAHWRSDLKTAMRGAEDMGSYFAREQKFDNIEEFFLYDAVGWSVFSHNLSPVYKLPFSQTALSKNPAETFKLAVLEGNIKIAKDEGGKPPLWLDKSHGALRANCEEPPFFDEMKEVFLAQLKWAIDDGADVIMAGEFACPSTEDEIAFDAFLGEVREVIKKASRPVFLVAGSRHTPSEKGTQKPHNANVAMLFGGDPAEDNFDEELQNQPISHFKRSPSIGLGERIFSPESSDLPIYVTPFSSFGLLVCSDAFDTQIQFAFLRQNKKVAPRAQIILVPAYNRSDLFYQSCRYLSYLANATVVVVNSYPGDFPNSAVRFFTAGIEAGERQSCMEQRPNDFKDIPEKEKDHIIKASRQVNITTEIEVGETCRGVVVYEINSVMLGEFSRILSKSGGKLLKKALNLSKAKK